MKILFAAVQMVAAVAALSLPYLFASTLHSYPLTLIFSPPESVIRDPLGHRRPRRSSQCRGPVVCFSRLYVTFPYPHLRLTSFLSTQSLPASTDPLLLRSAPQSGYTRNFVLQQSALNLLQIANKTGRPSKPI